MLGLGQAAKTRSRGALKRRVITSSRSIFSVALLLAVIFAPLCLVFRVDSYAEGPRVPAMDSLLGPGSGLLFTWYFMKTARGLQVAAALQAKNGAFVRQKALGCDIMSHRANNCSFVCVF
jgi:hypothetical protein